mgnify:CR=1 FL=1
MSWLFSRALVAAYSEENSWDGEPSAQLNVMPTQHKFWRNDKTMEFSNLSRFGLTLHLLTESRGEELLTWFRAGFPVRTYPLPAKAQESPGQGQDSGKSLPGLLARYDPATHSLKTVQLSLLADLEPSSVTLPRWGSMRRGALYQRQMWVPTTSAKDCGLWPTPTRSDCRAGARTLTDGKNISLATGRQFGIRLIQAAKFWPTPTRHNAKECNAPAEATRNTPTLAHRAGGHLNPNWVEWLMGWPIGWTDLPASEMAKFLCLLQQHGKC